MLLTFIGDSDDVQSIFGYGSVRPLIQDWGSVAGAVDTTEDWDSVIGPPVTTEDWGSVT